MARTRLKDIFYDLLLRYSYNMWGNKLFQQPIYNGITLIIHVHVKHLKVSAVKNKYYIKTLQRPV